MAITHVANRVSLQTSQSALQLLTPTGTLTDDLTVAIYYGEWAYTSYIPSGWSDILGTESSIWYGNYQNQDRARWAYRQWTSTPPSSTAISASQYYYDKFGVAGSFRGVASYGGRSSLKTITSGTSISFNSVTTDTDGCLVLGLFGGYAGTGSVSSPTFPGDWTGYSSKSSYVPSRLGFIWQIQSSAGPITPSSVTSWNRSFNSSVKGRAITAWFRPIPDPPSFSYANDLLLRRRRYLQER